MLSNYQEITFFLRFPGVFIFIVLVDEYIDNLQKEGRPQERKILTMFLPLTLSS